MRPLVAHCHLGLGKLYRRTGDQAKAQEHLTTATTMYREMDMTFWLEQAEAVLSRRSSHDASAAKRLPRPSPSSPRRSPPRRSRRGTCPG